MITIKLTPKTRNVALASALKTLKRGGVIAFATETVYGIGCDPRKAAAVNRLFAIKGREEKKPVQLIAGSIAQISKIADLHVREKVVAAKYWPGALTLLVRLKRSIRLAPRVSPKRVIGIRVTPDTFLSELIRRFGHPIAATSANRSGEPPATSGRGVQRVFHKPQTPNPKSRFVPDLLLDAGALPRRKPSTVARVFEDGRVEVMRQGGVRLGS